MDALRLDVVDGDDVADLVHRINAGFDAIPLPSGVPPHDVTSFGLALRDADGETEGGLTARSVWDWFYVETLWVTEARRGQGLGARLMEAAESEARRRGCQGLWVSTYSFQAPAFYERQGFEKFGEIDDFPKNHRRLFYKKPLTPTSHD